MSLPPALDARGVKSRVNFFAIASRYMRLRRAGRQFVGLCPFHSERHPSCYIHPEKKSFHCFGCGAGGDVFDFVMLAEGCDFPQALRIVSDFSGGSEARPAKRAEAKRRGLPPGPAKQGIPYSPESRAKILARLDATNRRIRASKAANHAASLELATACEPERSFLLEETK